MFKVGQQTPGSGFKNPGAKSTGNFKFRGHKLSISKTTMATPYYDFRQLC